MKKIILCLYITFSLLATLEAQAQLFKFYRAHIMNYFKSNDNATQSSDLWPIIAHRGYFRGATLNKDGKYYPENGLSAITRAHNAGIEAVEMDVRCTLDRVPMIMHDVTTGRTVDSSFDPMLNNTAQGINNRLSEYPLQIVRQNGGRNLMAWDIVNNKKTASSSPNEIIPTLYEAVRHVIDNDLKVLLLLDIFSKEDLIEAYKKVQLAGGLDFCIFKIGSGGKTLGTVTDVYRSLGLMDLRGNVTADFHKMNMAIIIYEESHKDFYDWAHWMRTKAYENLVFVELINKDFVEKTPNLYAMAQYCQDNQIRVGQYLAKPNIIGYIDKNGNRADGYTSGSGWGVNQQKQGPTTLQPGGCCPAHTYTFLENFDNIDNPFVRNTRSADGKIIVITPNNGVGATVYTSDGIENLQTALGKKRKRNTNWYKCGKPECGTSRISGPSESDEVNLSTENLDVSATSSNTIVIYPNPVKNEMNVEFNSETATPARFTLYALDGKEILEKQFDAIIGTNILVIDTQSVPTGVYVVKIVTDSTTLTQKVVVNK